ncbi:TRAF-like family protein [Rhynchospora pubera]|uniref:TRAF-like family protein n=1 Tax=Rhynchospora pubera TaxID=906938 RepID=A0AAV8H366_9POAL|nr:TRAF-like family protein [Rhynchospora pubera]KAJ4809433.1 TRAF-like family protein [Rhynchospora pubera]
MGASNSAHETEQKKRNIFVWKIDGFTSLLEQGEGSTTTPFNMHGIRWYLSLNPTDRKIGDTSSCEKHVSLFVSVDVSPDYMLETKFKYFIQAHKYGKHAEREVSHTYMVSSDECGVACMLPLETVKDPSAGYLVHDTIVVGVELQKFAKVPCNGVERISCVGKKKSSSLSYNWCLEDFLELKEPIVTSDPFQNAGYTWRLKLKPEGGSNKEYISLYLVLDRSASKLQLSSGVMVDVVFSINKSQTEGYNKQTFRYNFTGSNTVWGLRNFISRQEFKDPANGFLIKGRCTFKASITIFGSTNDHASD